MSKPDNHSCVLFDLDNTLVGIPNTWFYFDGLIQKVLTEIYSLPVPTPQERNKLWRSGKQYIKILKNWGVTEPDDFWIQFDTIDARERNLLISNNELLLFEDVIPTLSKLASDPEIKTGVVTNTPIFIADEELKAYDLHQYFDEILGLGDDQMICKPEPDGILIILEKLNVSPFKTLYVGDSVVDMLAAKRAGVLPLLVDREGVKGDSFKDIDEKDFIRIKSLNEIFQHIR